MANTRANTKRFTYNQRAERPIGVIWWHEEDGDDLVDFSDPAYTFTFYIGTPGNPLLTKTSGIAGTTGSGVNPTGAPNVLITWDIGELDIQPGLYDWQCVATLDGFDRYAEGDFKILPAIR